MNRLRPGERLLVGGNAPRKRETRKEFLRFCDENPCSRFFDGISISLEWMENEREGA